MSFFVCFSWEIWCLCNCYPDDNSFFLPEDPDKFSFVFKSSTLLDSISELIIPDHFSKVHGGCCQCVDFSLSYFWKIFSDYIYIFLSVTPTVHILDFPFLPSQQFSFWPFLLLLFFTFVLLVVSLPLFIVPYNHLFLFFLR